MPSTRFAVTLAFFIYGTLAGDLPVLRLGLCIIGLAVVMRLPRGRRGFAIAAALGVLNATLRLDDYSVPPNFLPSTPAVIQHLRELDNGRVLTLVDRSGLTFEGWFANDGSYATLGGIGVQRPLAVGDTIKVSGTFAAFDEARNPGAISPREIAVARGIRYNLVHGIIQSDDGPQWHNPQTWLPIAQGWSKAALDKALSPTAAALMPALLWGDQDGISSPLRAAFVTTGTIHVLTPAGLHIGLLSALLLGALQTLRCGRIARVCITIPLLGLYVLFTGGHIPARRAATAGVMLLGAHAFGTRAVSSRAYGIVLGAICAWNPSALLGLGFWLSFACVGSIMAFTGPISARLKRLPHLVAEAIAITIAAQIGTWPLLLLAAPNVGLTAPLANLVVVPLALIAFTAGCLLMVALAIKDIVFEMLLAKLFKISGATPAIQVCTVGLRHIFSGVELLLRSSCELCCALMDKSVILAARSFDAFIPCRQPPLTIIIVSYGLLTLSAWLIYDPHAALLIQKYVRSTLRPRLVALLSFGLAQALPLSAEAAGLLPGPLKITVLDVGQGDGIVIETPRHHVLVIDTGGKLELHAAAQSQSPAERAAAAVVLPFLAFEGIRAIDLMVLTHPHGDHVGGAAPILIAMPVHVIYDSGQAYSGRAFRDALRIAASEHVPIHLARRGDRYQTDDGVLLEILAPFVHPPTAREAAGLPWLDPHNAINEGSIVLRLSYQGRSMLFTGDAGIPTEARLLAAGDNLTADVLKVGHHGSAGASSPEFIAAVHPRLAIISVGRHNLFHHPSRPTLETLQQARIRVVRTDQCGAITLDLITVTPTLACTDSQTRR